MQENSKLSAIEENKQPEPVPASRWPYNWIDREFAFLVQFIRDRSLAEVKNAIITNLSDLEKKNTQTYYNTINYYNKYKLWGEYYPEKDNHTLADNRAQALWGHLKDFEWLYGRLNDYRSKKVLTNILSYWLSSDSSYIYDLSDKYFHQYFDYDILSCLQDEVIVDLGAFIGDTMIDYVKMFGAHCYKRYYCYEIVPENVHYIHKNVELYGLRNIEVREKGASDKNGTLYLSVSGVPSISKLAESGERIVQTVRIDDDVPEPVTFIKMDIEGGEEQALLGCRKKILENHPKLALSVYHNHEDLWRLARIIEQTDPTYRFYLRYYGYGLLPTEYVLYAI